MKQINKSFPQPLLLTGRESTTTQNNYRDLAVSEVRVQVNFEALIPKQLPHTLQVLQLNVAMFYHENSNTA